MLPRVHVDKIRSMLHGGSTLKEAALRIGEKQEVLIRLVKRDMLPTAFRAGPEGYAAHILKEADVDELIDSLTDGVPQVAIIPRRLMSLRRISNITFMRQAEIIRLILDENLKPNTI
jgi:hypothetical protein